MMSIRFVDVFFVAPIPPESIILIRFLAFKQANLWNDQCKCHVAVLYFFKPAGGKLCQ